MLVCRLVLVLFISSLFQHGAFAVDTDKDGVPDAVDPEPNNILVTGYQPLWLNTFNGDSAGDNFGISVSSAGDVNNDGYDDVIVGSPEEDSNGGNSGNARIFSGANGAILYTFNGDSAHDQFGYSVSGAGDVNNDGYDDVIVGARYDDNNGTDSGSARVLSGADGTVLYVFNSGAGDQFGYSVSGAGDVNNDGYDDVIVGACYDDNNGTDSGSAQVLSGADGAVLYVLNGDSAGDLFGVSVSGAGDVNNDGYDDVIVGARYDDNNGTDSGSARVLSGADGGILYTFNGDSAGDQLGVSVNDAGDVNNDNYADMIVGALQEGTNSGSARVLSGANGAILYTFNGDSANDQFGYSVSDAGDVNNDGYDDVIVGARYDDNNGGSSTENSGSARVLSGANGAILYTFNGDSAEEYFGVSVSGAGDVNNDGYDDVIVGAYRDDNNGTNSGSARVFSGVMFLQQSTDTDGDGQVDTLDTDDDNDGMADEWELQYGFDALVNEGQAAADPDGDGLSNREESQLGTNPFSTDSDLDGVPDAVDPEPNNILVTGYQPPWLNTFSGDSAGDYFGYSVSGAGDVNNDGYDDVIVGSPEEDSNGGNSGNARIFSGANGAILYTFNGDSAHDQFGYSVSGAGDVNNDGYDDVIVGARYDDNNGTDSGSAQVLSGADGAVLYVFNGVIAGDWFGWSVSGAGDMNNDGYDDVIVGVPYNDNNLMMDNGRARVLSGKTGSILYTFNGDSANDWFGYSVSGAGDVNNDGYDDVIVGAPLDDNSGSNSGSVRVLSGANGAKLYTFNGDSVGDYFGYSVSGAGDVNNDGYDDVIVGAYQVDNNGRNLGSARVLSGANGTVLYTFTGDGGWFGYSVSGAGDVNNDGYDDVIVGAYRDDNNGMSSGSVRVLSGADGSILYTFNGDSAGDGFGYSVSSAGDVNNDGYDDVIVGAHLDDNYGGGVNEDSGTARVFSGAMFLQQTMDTDGDGQVNTLDADDDADGIPDASDAFPQDTDNDGLSNAVDTDDDNDGVLDIHDQYPLSASAVNSLLMRNSSTGAWQDFFLLNAAVSSSASVALDNSSDTVYQGQLDSGVLTRKTSTGEWFLNNTALAMTTSTSWQYQGNGDFDNDGDDDILMRNSGSGLWFVYYLQNGAVNSSSGVGIYANSSFVFQGTGDMNGDGRDDVLFRSTSTGQWYAYNFATNVVSGIGGMWLSNNWQFQALMDFNNDGLKDILARQTNAGAANPGSWGVFRLNSSFNIASIYALTSTYQNLSLIGFSVVGDYDGNGTDDLLLRNTSTGAYYMFTTNAPAEANPGLQTMRGYPALYGSPWSVLK